MGYAEGAKVYLAKNAPPFLWALALAYAAQVLTSLSTPQAEGGAREARRGEGERATSLECILGHQKVAIFNKNDLVETF